MKTPMALMALVLLLAAGRPAPAAQFDDIGALCRNAGGEFHGGGSCSITTNGRSYGPKHCDRDALVRESIAFKALDQTFVFHEDLVGKPRDAYQRDWRARMAAKQRWLLAVGACEP